MVPIDTAHLENGEGQVYCFDIYPLGPPLPKVPAICIYTRESDDGIPWPPLYIGQTEDLSALPGDDNAAGADCALRCGASHIGICFLDMGDYHTRIGAQESLVQRHNPPCNL